MDAYDDIAGAYEGVEALEGFSPEALEVYRAELLERSADQIAFLRPLLPPAARVLEVASGNGRLLVALAAAGALHEGFGLEIARSRVAFAERWAADEGLDGLRFVAEDVLAGGAFPAELDAAVCITGALAYFEPMRAGATEQLLRALHGALKPGGLLLLELYPHAVWRRSMDAVGTDELRTWGELPPEDPWRLYLSNVRWERDTGILHHQKLFVHRTSGAIDDSRREHLRLYALEELTALLGAAGFGRVEAAGGWSGEPYVEGQSELLVVTVAA